MPHSSTSYRRSFLIAIVLIALTYFLLPVYGFLSHKEKLPHLPYGWLNLPAEYPTTHILDDIQYSQSADAALDILVRHRASIDAPALSAAVAINGARVWAGTVGWHDVASGKPAVPKTQFRIGSTSKSITATTLARMLQAGLADLDQPLSQVYKELPNQQWATITPAQLASHTAGLVHYGQTKDLSGMYRFMVLNKNFINVEDAVSLFDDTPLLFEPGAEFRYSSLGTVLLSAYMQRVGGKPFQQLVSELVLQPLKMDDTSWLESSPRLATHYWRSERSPSRRIREWREVDLSHRLAGGGFISTSSDLVKLGAAYLDKSFLGLDTVEKIWKPQPLNDGEINKQNYAIGWRKGTFTFAGDESATFHHGGVSRGAQSWLVVLPEYKMSIAVNTNINTKEFSDFASVYLELAIAFVSQMQR